MLVNVGDDRSVEVDLRLAVQLSAIAGAINAAGFQAAGLFSANMTGNLSALSDQVALGRWGLAASFLTLLLAFVVGAFMSALLIEAGQHRRIRGIYAFSILLEGGLLLMLAAAETLYRSDALLLLGLSFLMGLQNAATTRISNARVRTTHMSGIATDLGIELAVLLGRAHDPDQASIVRARFKLHATTLGAFLLGGIAGAALFERIGAALLAGLAVALVAISTPELQRARAVPRD